MPKFPATVTMAAEGGWSTRHVYIVNRQLSMGSGRAAGRWSLRFWYCESAFRRRRWRWRWDWHCGAGAITGAGAGALALALALVLL